MTKNEKYSLMTALVAVPIIIYLYFLKWRTNTIYGDDIYIYHYHLSVHSFSEKINMSMAAASKYRPINGLVQHFMLDLFQKNLQYYYIFNIAIQSINTIIFARILDRFLRSPWFSLFFAMLVGLSRFAFYNITQLLNGGALEGLAMTFFLLSLLFIVNALVNDTDSSEKQKQLLWSLLFANLCIYTHERYIVLFPFIILLVIFSSNLKTLSLKQKINVSVIAVLSIALNVGIKKYVYSVPFFVGTGGTNIEFSFASAFTYFIDGVLSIFQINSHPEYLTGMSFYALPMADKALSLLVFCGIVGIFVFYFARVIKAGVISFLSKILDTSVIRQKPDFIMFAMFFMLLVLFGITLAPAIVTIRLEQRWLQAAFSVFILLIVIALINLPFKNNATRLSFYSIFIVLFLLSDHNYLNKGGSNFFMSDGLRSANFFRKAIDHDVIHPKTENIYYWVKKRDVNGETGMLWSIAYGDIFEFYQNKSKKIIYVDSVYQRMQRSDTTLAHFNKDKDQFIDIRDSLYDITGEFLKDSLKNYQKVFGN